MAERNLIPDDLLRQIIGVGQVDLLVGLPTRNQGDAVGNMVRAVRACLHTHFPRQRAALLNVDLGSTDGTPLLVQEVWDQSRGDGTAAHTLRTTHLMLASAADTTDEGGATRTILAAADLLQARCAVVLDAASAGITSERIAALASPVREHDVDLMAPIYCRPAAEGLLVTQLLRPLVRVLYGRHLREPLVPEFGCSGRFATHCTQAAWNASPAERRTHFWVATEALAGPFTVRQCELGPRRLSAGHARPPLQSMFPLVIGSAFACIAAHDATWLTRTTVDEVPTIGPCPAVPPMEGGPGGARFLQGFADDVRNLDEILRQILSSDTHAALVAASISAARAPFSDALWADTVVEFLTAFHHAVMRREHITQALLPLYVARTGSFLQEHGQNDPPTLEAAIASLSARFEELKPRIVKRWRNQHEVEHG